jgi:formyltetrahydrofolate-dependent phosphoribosylglycinamide formyltransferase
MTGPLVDELMPSFYKGQQRPGEDRELGPLENWWDCVENAEMTPKPPLRLAILLSGSGRTLQNLLDRSADGRLPASVVLVISNKTDAYGLTRAERSGVPTAVVDRKQFADRDSFSAAIFSHCRSAAADLVCMAGFLQLLRIPSDYTQRVLNIHPALLPAFGGQGMYGQRVHEAVLEYGAKVSGCTVHFADNQYDHGPVVLQRAVEVRDDDTPDTLAERVFAAECEAYPEAIRLFAEGTLHLDGRRVRVRG